MSKTDAEYMRAYRARKNAETPEPPAGHLHETARWLDGPLSFAVARCMGCGWQGDTYESSLPNRYAELEAELAHLKRQLAAEAHGGLLPRLDHSAFAAYRPVPKPGKHPATIEKSEPA